MSANKKPVICIISHTEHYQDQAGEFCAWGATVREINHLLEVAHEVIHIAPLHSGIPPKSSLYYSSKRIQFIPLKPSGGSGWRKLSIFATAFHNLKIIHKHSQQTDFIQFRAPTGMGIYVLPYLKLINKKNYWVKYAGNWVDTAMPLGNRLQKWWLSHCVSLPTKVTLNGNWSQPPHIIPFENPSLTDGEYQTGKKQVTEKLKASPKQYRLCFVGALTEHKGVGVILEAMSRLTSCSHLAEMTFIGDSSNRKQYEKLARSSNIPVRFLGHCSKEEVAKEIAAHHFLLLPSKSEGFPKVIGEAMNFGCIPIVTDVSCISDYIQHHNNGFLLKQPKVEDLVLLLEELKDWPLESYQNAIQYNHSLAKKFTYSYYNQLLKTQVWNV